MMNDKPAVFTINDNVSHDIYSCEMIYGNKVLPNVLSHILASELFNGENYDSVKAMSVIRVAIELLDEDAIIDPITNCQLDRVSDVYMVILGRSEPDLDDCINDEDYRSTALSIGYDILFTVIKRLIHILGTKYYDIIKENRFFDINELVYENDVLFISVSPVGVDDEIT